MTSFLALYRGQTVSGARIVALSADPLLVRDFAARLLESPPERHPGSGPPSEDTERQMPRAAEPEGEPVEPVGD